MEEGGRGRRRVGGFQDESRGPHLIWALESLAVSGGSLLETLVDVIVTCHFWMFLFVKHLIFDLMDICPWLVDAYNLCPVFSSARL